MNPSLATSGVPFMLIPGTTDLLGITQVNLNVLKSGLLFGTVKHTPNIKIDGSVLITLQIGTVKPFLIDLTHDKWTNPNGLPIVSGQGNVIFIYKNLSGTSTDVELINYFKSMRTGDLIHVSINHVIAI